MLTVVVRPNLVQRVVGRGLERQVRAQMLGVVELCGMHGLHALLRNRVRFLGPPLHL